jgi:hypothetical protein
MPCQQNEAVKPQVRGFAHDMQFITVLRRKQSFGRLLGYFLEHLILAFGEKPRNVRSRGISTFARSNGAG